MVLKSITNQYRRKEDGYHVWSLSGRNHLEESYYPIYGINLWCYRVCSSLSFYEFYVTSLLCIRLTWLRFRLQDFIKSTLQDIVSDELRKIKGSSQDEGSVPLFGTDTDDMIWEYEGLQTAYRGDCEEMLLEMQKIFYEDLRTEDNRKG